ncbi:TPA: 30S ribosomal protein S13 [Patescibacteria group bacterium]|uniref:Small ribosomal subunit protein uS13 n=2 Tax=Bacteria division Kazan-3B-28 TaxID=1798534 RepID=A0A0G1KUG2_UNCK3|nr:MAG: Ribosomal protein S13 [candidate division Kazan bacterium GW2011_GWA1_44_22]KKT87125.1 MAG: Ribosomal protein S13 [candidate division Kazan bacterium GW2011_GWB1_45_10]HAR54937.1 30S ribosomal protein S13 [Patescibacteria group bacterium]HCR41898.1 30S ribosomal protein S13 [Patescibacteria group bacterium]
MVRILGIQLPGGKRAEVALAYLYGVGLTRSREILAATKIDPNKRTDAMTEEEANRIREFIEKNYTVEGDLRREISTNIKRLKDINSYRGDRHKKNLPVRGQTTKTNARTKRGKRVTVGSGRKKSSDKT